jgi:hypothetical protein
MDEREKIPDRKKKKTADGMDVCVLFVVRTVVWNISDMKKEGRI